ALMAGENVSEPIVRKVFSTALDYVVHCDLDDINRVGSGEGIRRQVTEIIAMVPSLHDSFSTEPLFQRGALGKPLEWTGALPVDAELIERSLPPGLTLRGILEGRVSPL
ncbi:MAG TPA: hypothetical protein VML96_01630, partial [Egibacteraceae bacterium]|nr:hypothetical protein [Egibacteraceae bacterium]